MSFSKEYPDKFEIRYSCFTITLFNTVIFEDNKILFNSFYSKNESFPDHKQWKKFWEKLDQFDIWSWEKSYINFNIIDGCAWSIDLTHNNKKIKSSGSNAWPENFKEFIRALEDLTSFDITEKVEEPPFDWREDIV
ncbi:MAG: hypothetical protein Q7V10_02085 [Methanobacteriaceae archaeon]|nr:hypothetical protein [Methanobacteriaceae archaeon]MDO9625997.1 hypothetical protein [Methanobacteriaceae archaeon]